MISRGPLLALILGLLAFFLVFWAGVVRHDPTTILEDRFDGTPTELALNLSDPPHWPVGAPLVLGAGESGHLVYDVSAPPDARVTASVVCGAVPSLEARMRVLWSVEGNRGEVDHPLRPGLNEIDLTTDLPPTGLIRLALEAQMPLRVSPQRAFDRLEFTIRLPRVLHRQALVFLFLLGAVVWVGIPALLSAELCDRVLPRFGRLPVLSTAAIVGVAVMILPHRVTEGGRWEPHLTGRKFFDDSRAISNAALLVANGGDVTQLYFRSFERPGFLAHTLPLCLVFPQRFLRASHEPSDFHVRLWREFDRAGSTFGSLQQLEISLVSWFEAMALAIVWAMIWRRLGAGPRAACLAGLLGGLATAHVFAAPNQVNAPISLTWNLLANAVAVLAALRLLDAPGIGRAAIAGAMLALAALTKTTAITSVAPLLVLLAGRVASRSHALTLARSHALLWSAAAVLLAAAIVLWWFEGLMGGLVATLRQHPDDFARIMEQHPEYPRRTLLSALLALWRLAGPGWLLVALGLTLGARRLSLRTPELTANQPWHVSREAWTFALLWALSGLQALVMPFLFPRFFKYMAPGLGLLACAGVIALFSRRGAETQSGPVVH